MKNISYLLIGFFFSVCQAQSDNINYSNAFKLIDAWLESQKDYESIPGIVAMVVQDQDLIWSGAFGKSNIEKNINAELSTMCSICSITKTFTAVAIMKLVDDGKIKLDDNVIDILPSLKIDQNHSNKNTITIRSLLSHGSGLPRDTGHRYWSAPDFTFPTKKQLNTVLKELETENIVGGYLNYSNLGYALLGQIIEQVSGMSYTKYLKTQVLNPLRMYNSEIDIHKKQYENQYALGYTAINRNRTRERVNSYQTKTMSPAAGLSTSISDLAKYASWQFRLRDASSQEVLYPASLKKMHEVQSKSKDSSRTWGLGFEVYTDASGITWATHGGICPGYVSYLKLDLTNKMAYGIMVNANGVRAYKLLNGITSILKKMDTTSENNIENKDFEEYTGYYNLNPWNSEYYISTWEQGLVLLYLPSKNPVTSMYFYKKTGKDTFRLVNSNHELTDEIIFERDKKGKIYRVLNEGNYHLKI
ncbi:serine hydrolase domain-containing protein [Aquimarina sp. 2201CG5-10]|uniref:serine hydrolase domain-containing protein n=1 Tax=Aquimarina callyspongiae TaxID=3098150 RepID=UPI002AB5CA97|nr:serine hydrolase domain-containing protein [Aquimarina sp. 2201CG5-10]MDY8134668.1 serine hydrolase domain-containing protein [Aquimarina sp. 2201CG5-10]